MTDYSDAEVLNEAARVFRARIDPGKEGGTINTTVEYQQLLETASTTFLLYNDAVYHVAWLARNRLLSLVGQEIDLIEDILVSLDHLEQVGSPVRDTTILSNARTALLALDAAGAVQGRPEARRFSILMDQYVDQFRKNVISSSTGQMVRPREQAQRLIRTNLTRIEEVHDQMLAVLFALDSVVEEFIDLDIPSKVSTTAIVNVRDQLDTLEIIAEDTNDADNIVASRASVLAGLTSKVAVESIADFTNPGEVKVRTPILPVPPNLKHLGRVVGSGEAASLLSSPGPWDLPLSAPIQVSVNGGAPVTSDIDDILGTSLVGSGDESFSTTEESHNLHFIVDQRTITDTVGSASASFATLSRSLGLSFKNLGAPISFPGLANPDNTQRAIADLQTLQTGTVSSAISIGEEKWRIVFSSWSAGNQTATGLVQGHVGGYFRSASSPYERWEILVVEDANTAVVSVPYLSPAVNPPTFGSLTLKGDYEGLNTYVVFTPSLSVSASGAVTIAPAVKTVSLEYPNLLTVADVIGRVQGEDGEYDPALGGTLQTWRYQTLHQYARVREDPENTGRLSFIPRSADSLLVVNGSFTKVESTTGIVVKEASAHGEVGLLLGQAVSLNALSVSDLAAIIQSDIPGTIVTEEQVILSTGTLRTSSQTGEVVGDGLELAGVGDEIALPSGTFRVVSLNPVTVETTFSSNEDVPYTLTRTRMKLASASTSRGSSIRVLSGPAELGFGTSLVKGSIPTFEAVDRSGNKLSFTGLVVEGDILDVAGLAPVAITEVSGTLLTLSIGLAADVERRSFEVLSSAAVQYSELVGKLDTFINSRQLLKKHGFNQGLEALNDALARALIPGQNFASNRNQAKTISVDLLSILTGSPRRSDEYSTSVPTAALNLEDILGEYDPTRVPEVDGILDLLLDRQYTRAANLLQSGRIREFFDTTEETASFPGAMMSAARQVVTDLPDRDGTQEGTDRGVNIATSAVEDTDPDHNLDDTEFIDGGLDRR
jgi:hypothetical protein